MEDSEIQSRRDLWRLAYAFLCLPILAPCIAFISAAVATSTWTYHLLYLPIAVFLAWASYYFPINARGTKWIGLIIGIMVGLIIYFIFSLVDEWLFHPNKWFLFTIFWTVMCLPFIGFILYASIRLYQANSAKTGIQ